MARIYLSPPHMSSRDRELLIEAFEACGGNQTRAGLRLGLHGAPAHGGALELRTRKLAHRKFSYWWKRLVAVDGGVVEISARNRARVEQRGRCSRTLRAEAT